MNNIDGHPGQPYGKPSTGIIIRHGGRCFACAEHGNASGNGWEAKDLGITALRIGTMTKLKWRIRAKSAHIAACHGS
jgi:hypothetical protein